MGTKKSKIKFILVPLGFLIAIAIFQIVGRHGDRSVSETSVAPESTPFPLVTQQSKSIPEPPFLVDWCEDEDCDQQVSKNVVCDTNLYLQADTSSKVVGKIIAGQIVKDRTLFTKILKLGSYLADSNRRVSLVSYVGDRAWTTFQDGKWDVVQWEDLAHETEAAADFPKTEAWVLIETMDRITGFARRFGGTEHSTCPLAEATR